VYECMRDNGHLLGGEQSGHIIFGKYANTGDGLLTAIKVMQAMMASEVPLSKLAEPMQMYPQVLKNIRVTDKDGTLSHPDVLKAVKAAEEKLGKDGRVLLRKSGTEPVLRVMAESHTQELCEKCVMGIIQAMKDNNLVLEEK